MLKEIKDTTLAILGWSALIVGCNVVTPLAMCGLPRLKNLIGRKIQDVRVEHFAAEEAEDEDDYRSPEYLDIKYNSSTLTVNLEENNIYNRDGDDMNPCSFGFDSSGSGGIGIMLFGIPGAIVCLPAILVCNAAWYGVYKLTDMDVNYYLFWRRIKDQLDGETRHRLKSALINTSRKHRNYDEG